MKHVTRILNGSLAFAAALLLMAGCTSTGNLGILSNSETEADLGPHDPHTFHRVGSEISGKACRHFILGVLPIGSSDIESALRDALSKHPELKADGLVHISVQSTLYGFFPIYNVYTVTCTTIRGVPIRFDHSPKAPPHPAASLPQTGVRG
ncbi:hypothetical protein ACSYAY_00470 [Leptospirillum ferriphilum]|jgi:hypothetical protein|uniref:Lipoprotein n=2 Tax=Leptospirillum TaxID=179 RepID=A0A094X6N2_9BACT|nr:hypothetical protein [Leptospirillum ferriphilum]EDZ38390.1 MAG: Conserved protein of unknown function [Leptospirillum sp. Group II '5-way CG']KGA94224.1 hypothetical protein LptCag_0987 [Leptospirillum ferriphilum]